MNTNILQKIILILLLSSSINASYNVNVVPKKMSVQEKKKRFRDLVVPAVERVYNELDVKYKEVKRKIESGKLDANIEKLMNAYSAKNPQNLLVRMKPHAKSVAIAQAAMESAWATSRFTRVATNLFGVHSVNVHEPRVKASSASNVYVTKYANVEDAIRAYYKVLSTGKAFTKFREVKMSSNNPYKLVKELDKYSQKGSEYGKELTSMIRYNRFYKYD